MHHLILIRLFWLPSRSKIDNENDDEHENDKRREKRKFIANAIDRNEPFGDRGIVEALVQELWAATAAVDAGTLAGPA